MGSLVRREIADRDNLAATLDGTRLRKNARFIAVESESSEANNVFVKEIIYS